MIGTSLLRSVPELVRRRLDELPRAPALVGALRAALDDATGRRLAYHVYGGFVRACVTGERFTDVDVVAATRADRAILHSLSNRPIALIDASGCAVTARLDVARRVVSSAAALIGQIDLVMARLAFSTIDDCFHIDPDCLEAIATRTLTLRPVRSRLATPARTIGRTLKYAAKGGRLPLATLLWSLEEYRGTPAIVRWGEHRLRTLRHPAASTTGGSAASRLTDHEL